MVTALLRKISREGARLELRRYVMIYGWRLLCCEHLIGRLCFFYRQQEYIRTVPLLSAGFENTHTMVGATCPAA